jgi:hypothetical protein
VSFHYGALLGAPTIRGGPNEIAFSMRPADHQRLADLDALAQLVPPNASVAATEREGPHLSNRLTFYSLKTTLGFETEYVLYGRRVDVRDERENVMRALASRKYGLEAERGEFRLLRRGASPEHNLELAAALAAERRPTR